MTCNYVDILIGKMSLRIDNYSLKLQSYSTASSSEIVTEVPISNNKILVTSR